MAAVGAGSVLGSSLTSATDPTDRVVPEGFIPETPIETYHPGPPRFVSVGEPLVNSIRAAGANTVGSDSRNEGVTHE